MTLSFNRTSLVQVSSLPLSVGGASFRTHTLHRVPGGYKFAPTLGAKLFWLVFTTMGALGILAGTVGIYVLSGASDFSSSVAFVGVGALFVYIGRWGMWECNRTRNIDTSRRVMILRDDLPLPFEEVIALQILKKRCIGSEMDYDSYELNVVTREYARRNIIDHSDETSIEQDARILAEAIGCPIIRD